MPTNLLLSMGISVVQLSPLISTLFKSNSSTSSDISALRMLTNSPIGPQIRPNSEAILSLSAALERERLVPWRLKQRGPPWCRLNQDLLWSTDHQIDFWMGYPEKVLISRKKWKLPSNPGVYWCGLTVPQIQPIHNGEAEKQSCQIWCHKNI